MRCASSARSRRARATSGSGSPSSTHPTSRRGRRRLGGGPPDMGSRRGSPGAGGVTPITRMLGIARTGSPRCWRRGRALSPPGRVLGVDHQDLHRPGTRFASRAQDRSGDPAAGGGRGAPAGRRHGQQNGRPDVALGHAGWSGGRSSNAWCDSWLSGGPTASPRWPTRRNRRTGELVVLDRETLTPRRHVDVGVVPDRVDSAGGGRVVVVSSTAGLARRVVTLVSAVTGDTVWSIEKGFGISDVAVAPAGRRVLLADHAAGSAPRRGVGRGDRRARAGRGASPRAVPGRAGFACPG